MALDLLSPSLSSRLRDLYGNSIAFAIRSFDPSLSGRLILFGHLIYYFAHITI